ncbi:tetratricopeptide repeat protein [Thiothrix fructosivorans]|uniref:Tetratricopeptide repeat protein n=1 Tax=Thiothrix fructosivorans TaxID=111770 RepID=A0A8B0SMD5_9GAMM|nr:tetratricopeptide repeat protein [Thiothrix fructosivorans]MBO0615314.1 hypothetical protein [Thiothrix fructosivorans]QTX10092.1 hypothetical protein J1836_016055 [Thiothrix fructosivorans]
MNRYSTLFSLLLLCATPLTVLAQEQDFMAEAEKASVGGDWEKATTLYRQAVEKDPNSSLALSRLAGSLMASQKYGESISVFQQAIGKDQKNASAFIGMGISYLHLGRYNATQAAFAEAKKLQPDKKELDEVITWVEKKLAAEEQAAATPPSAPSTAPHSTPPAATPAPPTQGEVKP